MAIAIKRYNIVQTGANTQSGGLKGALFKVEYQGSLCEIVDIAPIKDAE